MSSEPLGVVPLCQFEQSQAQLVNGLEGPGMSYCQKLCTARRTAKFADTTATSAIGLGKTDPRIDMNIL